ncbi:Aste57867_20283 [Aphanomyces stellatus]|uniref:Aste57867_20283 protein n=1 Tax=Aphanomyces stellatus TaxID=120398 RepID=A0A485LFC2_9STRA|nr:hypothetical protein As57867_020217 [Aphanomyces stellatus]VFT96973.1 Aste57867_20283 [Aphanomyces stellatus]
MRGEQRKEWTPPPPVDARARAEPNHHLFLTLLYAPVIPLIRIGLRGRLPQKQIDRVFLGSIGVAFVHAGYILSSESSA